MSAKATTPQRTPPDIALVLIGPKRHAARFSSVDATKASSLARSLKFRAVRVTTDRLREVARRLPVGKLSAKWPKEAPRVEAALYKQLLAVTGGNASDKPSTPPALTSVAEKAPVAPKSGSGEGGADILKGSHVLATQDPDAEGWWACEVVRIEGDTLWLKWLSAAELGTFSRKRNQVAPHPLVKPC